MDGYGYPPQPEGGSNVGLIIGIVVVLIIIISVAIGVGVWYTQKNAAETDTESTSGSVSDPAPAPAPAPAPTPKYRDYTFYQGDDSGGGDIEQNAVNAGNADALKGHCDTLSGCVGFTTNGWMKNKIIDAAYRTKWTTDPAKGLYVLSSYTPYKPAATVPRTYTFYQGDDSGGYDIKQDTANANNIAGLKSTCDSLAGCVGFNTNGWMKNKISASHYKWTTDPAKGLYVLSSYTQV